jgi:hypothetical protein
VAFLNDWTLAILHGMTTKLQVIKWGMIGFVLAASLTELVCGHGPVSWGVGYWVVVCTALWGASAGHRMRRRAQSKIRKMTEKDLPAARIAKFREGESVISMVAAFGIAYLGIVIRFILHGTRWQVMPFYVLGLVLLFLWDPGNFDNSQRNRTPEAAF